MSSNSTATCAPGDNLCVVRFHQQEVIVVPTLLLLAFASTLIAVCVLRRCPDRRRRPRPRAVSHRQPSNRRSCRPDRGRDLQGIDAPVGLDPMEHEVVVQMAPRAAAPPPAPGGPSGAFSGLAPLPPGFSLRPGNTARYRARMGGAPVVLRVLRETADSAEKDQFLGFPSFLSGLGPHPFLPTLVGVVSAAPPLMMVMEDLQHQDLLDFLWRCRQEGSSEDTPHHMTQKRIFIMAGQVASALEFLHGRRCIHGNVRARSVLIAGDLTAKLWGLGPAYRRARGLPSPWEQGDAEMRKWRAPEVLTGRDVTQAGDVWSFGLLLFEMASLGEAPFAEVPAAELLQQLQRGKSPERPAHCSNALNSVIRSCCQFAAQQRPSLAQLIQRLRAGEASANGRTVLRAAGPIDIGKYLREAGYGEAHNYAVL